MNFYNYEDRSISLIRKKKCEYRESNSSIDSQKQLFANSSSTGEPVMLDNDDQGIAIFNFKVLELKTFKDFKDSPNSVD